MEAIIPKKKKCENGLSFMRDSKQGICDGEILNLPGGRNFNAGFARIPKEQFAGVNSDGQVYVLGSGMGGMENQVKDASAGGILRGGVNRCRMIDGHAYIAGGGRSVGFRSDDNIWVSLIQEMPFEYRRDWKTAGFRDFDGFNAKDIYCAGGKGDV